jgi:hypothetical protein
MTEKSSIDFGSIVLGKFYVEGYGSPGYECARSVEMMRLQVLAGKRLKREAERQRIRVEREARTRMQFEALREKRVEEYSAEVQKAEAARQYQQHLERHKAEKQRRREGMHFQRENRRIDPEGYQRTLEGGRQADEAAGIRLRAGSLEQGLVDSWQRIEDMTSERGAILRPCSFQVREREDEQIALSSGVEMNEDELLGAGIFSEQEMLRAQAVQESGDMEDLEREMLEVEGFLAPVPSASALRRLPTEPNFVRAGVLAEQVQGQSQHPDQRLRPQEWGEEGDAPESSSHGLRRVPTEPNFA